MEDEEKEVAVIASKVITSSIAPANGIYIVEFMKPGTMNQPEHICTHEMNFKFVSYQDGWTIHGNGNDNDGRIILLGGGFVDGNGNASWRETIGTDIETSSIGIFNFHNHTFTGTISWGNVSKPYIKFFYKKKQQNAVLVNESDVTTIAVIESSTNDLTNNNDKNSNDMYVKMDS